MKITKKGFGNTKKQGFVRIFTYQEKGRYISVCLELDIVKEGVDKDKLRMVMGEAIEGYVETVCKNNLPDILLNRPAPEKYWKKFREYIQKLKIESNVSQMQRRVPTTFNFGAVDQFPIRELCGASA